MGHHEAVIDIQVLKYCLSEHLGDKREGIQVRQHPLQARKEHQRLCRGLDTTDILALLRYLARLGPKVDGLALATSKGTLVDPTADLPKIKLCVVGLGGNEQVLEVRDFQLAFVFTLSWPRQFRMPPLRQSNDVESIPSISLPIEILN